MKSMFSVMTAVLAVMVASECFAAPTLATPTATNVGAGSATLVLQSSGTGTGYFTILAGSNATCGSGDQTKSGLDSLGAPAFRFGSLALAAGTDGHYTVRNLSQSSAYTVCFTADSPSGSNLNPVPLADNLSTGAAAALTGLDWSGAGSAGFSAGMANATSLAFAPDGTPYVAYGDDGTSSRATVMQYSDGVWINVGSAGFSAGTANATSLAFAPDGTPHLAYSDYGNSDKTTVKKYTSVDGWIDVGNPGFSAGAASNTSLAFAPDGTPYVAYGGDDYNSSRATVMKYSSVDGWVGVGTPGFSVGTAYSTSLAIAPDGTPYVAYADYGNSGKATVKKYSSVDGWVDVGIPGFSVFEAAFTSLAISPDGVPHVAYSDYGNNGKATVMKLSGGVWRELGAAGFSAGPANFTSLAFAPDGTPFVAFGDDSNGSMATVMKYIDGGWSVVGSAGFSAGMANATSLAFAPDGIPYVAYGDDGNSSRATVMKLGNPLTISGTPAATATVGIAYSFTPAATDADSFSVAGTLPPGLVFSTITGALSGTPTTVGTYSNIVISAINSLSSVSLPAFSIDVINSAFPDTAITSFPPNPSSSAAFIFTFTSTESGSTFECSLSGGAFGPCASPYSNSIVYAQCTACRAETATSFTVRAKSPAGNPDPTPATYAWTINDSIGVPCDNVLDGGVVQLKATDFTGNLIFSRGVAFTLKGGYDSGYSTNSGQTNIHGTVTISAGAVTFENIVIM